MAGIKDSTVQIMQLTSDNLNLPGKSKDMFVLSEVQGIGYINIPEINTKDNLAL